jgi:flagellar motor switch protein FliG
MDNNLVNTLSGLDKSAILFQVLGESLALTMFQSISESDILKIRVRSKELKNIPFDIKQAVLEEFYFKMMTQKYRQVSKSKKLFSFLDDLNDEQIFYLINTESSKVIALTLDQLSQEKKFQILNRFHENVKHNIIIEFAELNEIPLEGVVNIAHELKKKISFIPGPKEFSRGGARSIANLLNQMNTEEADQYLHQISQDDPELYAEVKKYFLSFDDLLEMEDHIMRTFWKNPEVDVDLLAKALKGFEQAIIDHVLSFLPTRKQKMYTPVTTPLSKKDVENSQQDIIKLAKDMAKNKELNLDDILSENEMIE